VNHFQKGSPTEKIPGTYRRKTAGMTDYANIKSCIAHLGHADKNKLKEMLGTDRIQVIYKSASSKAIKLTF